MLKRHLSSVLVFRKVISPNFQTTKQCINLMFKPTLRPFKLFESTLGSSRVAYTTKPPTYFSKYLDQNHDTQREGDVRSQPHHEEQQQQQQQQQQPSRFSTLRDLTVIISIVTLSYFAVDNYRAKLELEQKHKELSMKHIRTLANAQNNFNKYRKTREVQMLNERKRTQKREMKMSFHISMLRKQLVDSGLKPVDIDQAIAEFEKNVKMETSVSNVSGTALWVVDESPVKAYVPSVHEYDSNK